MFSLLGCFIIVCWGKFSNYHAWGLLTLLYFWANSFNSFFTHCALKYFCQPLSPSLSSGTLIDCTLKHLILVLGQRKNSRDHAIDLGCSIFSFVYSFFCVFQGVHFCISIFIFTDLFYDESPANQVNKLFVILYFFCFLLVYV